MISQERLQEQIDLAKRGRQTPPLIQQFVFSCVDKALREQYPDTFPDQEIEAARGIQNLLNRFEIMAEPFVVDFCFAQLFQDSDEHGWAGHWDDQTHVVAVTEFNEIVDLVIGLRHAHPQAARQDMLPLPAVWWAPGEALPAHFVYLPRGPVAMESDPEKDAELAAFLTTVTDIADRMIQGTNVDDIQYEPILRSHVAMDRLRSEGNQWIVRADAANVDRWPLPEYIERRMQELTQQHRQSS